MATVDTSDMVLIHRVIRREIGQLPNLFRGAAGDPTRAKIVGKHAAEMLSFLHHHHHGEDELLYPCCVNGSLSTPSYSTGWTPSTHK